MSQYTDNSSKLACGIGVLLLLCVAGCASEGACLWGTAKKEAAMGCDPYYGFRPTCWHPWPFCGAQPVLAVPVVPEAPMPSGDGPNGQPMGRPPEWEALPAPGAQQIEPPREPVGPPPQPNGVVPPLPNGVLPQEPSRLPPPQTNSVPPQQPNNMPQQQPNSVLPPPPNNLPPPQPNNVPPVQPNNVPPPQPPNGSSGQSEVSFQSVFDAPRCDQEGWPIDVFGECEAMAPASCLR